MLNMFVKTFDLDKHRGALLTQLQVLQIPLDGYSQDKLLHFRQKVTYALNSVPKEDRPDERLLGEWLYQRLKGCKKLEHEIREIKNSPSKSKKRGFQWLWRRMRDVLIENKEDANATSVNDALKSGPSAAARTAGAVAARESGKKKRKRGKKERASAAAAGASPAAESDAMAAEPLKKKPKAKAKGAPKKDVKSMTPAEKKKISCIFHFKFSGCRACDD